MTVIKPFKGTLVGMLLLLMGLSLTGCSANRVSPTPTLVLSLTPTSTSEPTKIASPSPSPTSRERSQVLATLRAQSTEQPCSPSDVIAYADRIIPLADQHLQAARSARSLQPWGEDQPEYRTGYIEADERLKQIKEILAPACAEKAQLKFTSSFELLLDVWDHLGEGEFIIAQRKLASSFDELGQASELLTELQENFDLLEASPAS